MSREIADDRNENMPALASIPPNSKLTDASLQHLIGMEACIFAQYRKCKRRDQRLWRMAKRKMARHQPCRKIDLSLPVEGSEQLGADRLLIGGEVIELTVTKSSAISWAMMSTPLDPGSPVSENQRAARPARRPLPNLLGAQHFRTGMKAGRER